MACLVDLQNLGVYLVFTNLGVQFKITEWAILLNSEFDLKFYHCCEFLKEP